MCANIILLMVLAILIVSSVFGYVMVYVVNAPNLDGTFNKDEKEQ
jgi:hypothetical protein